MNWREEDHPRDAGGMFTEKENGVKSFSEVRQDYERAVNRAIEVYSDNPGEDKATHGIRKNTHENKYGDNDTMTKEELAEFLGPRFEEIKGEEAVAKLMQEKRGHVKGAFVREDIGAIDLFWGNSEVGLQHILERREDQGINAAEFVKSITEVVEQGKFGGPAKAKDSFIFRTKDKAAVIGYTYKGNDIQYVLTAFLSHGGGRGKNKPPQ